MGDKLYLVKVLVDVADEGDVGLICVMNEEELDDAAYVRTGFGNIEGDLHTFEDVADIKEITREEYETLKKLDLFDIEFGYCEIIYDYTNDDDYDWDDNWDEEDLLCTV